MSMDLKKYHLLAALTAFVVLPLLFYAVGDVPRRSLLKESVSILTLLSFCLALSQFFLARSNEKAIRQFRMKHILRTHKVIAYSVLAVLLLHPLLVVLPRYFEAGVSPFDALVTMLTTFETPGLVLGMIAWCLMLILGVSAVFRIRIIKRLGIKYPAWRKFHGFLAIGFVVCAAWHAIDIGRHTGQLMSALFIAIAASGIALLLKMYLSPVPNRRERI